MLSVREISQKKDQIRARLFSIGKGATLLALLMMTLQGEAASVISGYDYYREAGSPEYGKVVYDQRSNQWGYWTQPAEAGEEADQPVPRRARRSTPVADPDKQTAPRTASRPAKRAKKPAPAPARTEAGCEDCAIAGATSTRGSQAETVKRTSNEILKVAGAAKPDKKTPPKTPPKKSTKRTAEVEKEEEGEYDAIDEDKEPEAAKEAKGAGKFVQKLLNNASIEAKRSCRKTSGGTKCKRAEGKSLGMCLQGVRMALQRTTGVSTNGGIGKLAKNAGPALRQFGYTKAAAGKYTPSTAPLGAILIYDAPGQPGKAGHIEIKGKTGSYSDYFNSRPLSELMPGRRRLIGIHVPPKN